MSPPSVRVPAQVIRDLFNNEGYAQAIAEGRYSEQVRRESHLQIPRSGEPYCSWSQLVSYRDAAGVQVVVAHRFKRPGGAIGASGRPDPKFLLHDGVIYKPDV
jgi:hypothetical protein